jgi:hypothetical protein
MSTPLDAGERSFSRFAPLKFAEDRRERTFVMSKAAITVP